MSFDPHRRLFLTRITGGRLSDHFFESIPRLEFGQVDVSFFLGSGHEIVQLPSSQLCDVLWTGHSTVDDNSRAFGKPHSFLKQLKHRGERFPILDVAFEDLVRPRKSFATDYQTHNDLFAVRPVVPRVATLGFGNAIGRPLEVRASQVVEQDRVSQIEEALFTLSQRRFNGNTMRMQTVEISIERIVRETRGIEFQDVSHSCGSNPIGHSVLSRGMDESIERHHARDLD